MAFASAPVTTNFRALHQPSSPLAWRCPPRRARLPASCRLRASFVGGNGTGGGGGGSSKPLRRFALISDVHVFDEAGIWGEDVTQFIGQRFLGLLNIMFLRGPGTFDRRILEAALVDMREQDVQHLVVAGDISNLSIASEFALAASIFTRFGDPYTMTFCPGNHDTYNRSQRKAGLFRAYFAQYCVSDLPQPISRPDGFPYAHFRGDVLFVVLNTGLPNTARGAVGRKQLRAAEAMLETTEGRSMRKRARFIVLVLHHPAQDPAVRRVPWIRELGHDTKDWRRVVHFSNRYRVNLVVHGHMHVPYRGVLAGAPQTLVYESGSGTLVSEDKSRVARYTIFELDEVGNLKRSYARVWDLERKTFDNLELPVPEIEGSEKELVEAFYQRTGSETG